MEPRPPTPLPSLRLNLNINSPSNCIPFWGPRPGTFTWDALPSPLLHVFSVSFLPSLENTPSVHPTFLTATYCLLLPRRVSSFPLSILLPSLLGLFFSLAFLPLTSSFHVFLPLLLYFLQELPPLFPLNKFDAFRLHPFIIPRSSLLLFLLPVLPLLP